MNEWILIIYDSVAAVAKLLWSATDALQEKYKAYHHLLKEVNDLLLRKVHGAVVKKGLRDRQFTLGREGICRVLYKGLLLLHPCFPETGNTITLKENSALEILKYCSANNPV